MSGLFSFDYLCIRFAIVAQLVERWLHKPKVAGSCPVYRSWRGFQKLELFLFLSAWEAKGLSDGSLPARPSRRSRDRAPSIALWKGSRFWNSFSFYRLGKPKACHRETILLCLRTVSSLCALCRHCIELPLL